ncbi:lysophospholipid acyltransferase family protein [Nocardioides sp.]|uniref:lysophospholipid acyltransferase family protein n=1 Tax=Nocardioides sp. TaxID=35761 RepID=UPI002D7E85FD|nr:lysophospholipid acyltransferase family protein [Nocardioides sp.]HET8960641.1 lysophospholipid acyltransferase family protein [Nocardioides sp.]
MTATRHTDWPRSDRIRHPRRAMMIVLRPLARAVLRRRLSIRVHGREHVPAGPVIFAGNHTGVMDGPLMVIFAPQPVHALTKVEMFSGRLGRLLRGAGQLPLDRFHTDPNAVKTCVRVLRDGHAVGIFPEGRRGPGDLERFHRGAAYFSLVTGAPVVPVIFLGTREPGGHTDSVPPRGSTVDIWFGRPLAVDPLPWPRSRARVEEVSIRLREHLVATLEEALATTGQQLPGPLPRAEVEPDPATGVIERDAS